MFFQNEQHKPFFQRTSTLIIIVGLICSAVIGTLLADGIYALVERVRTHEIQAEVVHQITNQHVTVWRWSPKKHYGKDDVPECAWNTSTVRVCDKYAQICVERDPDTGMCTSTIKGHCISSHYEYNYTVYDWVFYFEDHQSFWNTKPDATKYQGLSEQIDAFRMEVKYDYELVVRSDETTARVPVNRLPKKDDICVIQRIHSKRILRPCQN